MPHYEYIPSSRYVGSLWSIYTFDKQGFAKFVVGWRHWQSKPKNIGKPSSKT